MRKSLDAIISESIRKVINESMGGDPVTKWVYWCYNYYPNFIEEAWADRPDLVQHFKKKFMQYYDQYGPEAVMNRFFIELSSGHQQTLIDWVMNNYNG